MLITNISGENSLLTRLDHLIAGSEEMRVLVGFFYFWGISSLHRGISENENFKLKILAGLEAEDQAGKILEYAVEQKQVTTDFGGEESKNFFYLHKSLAIGAMRHGESLNEHCVHLLREEGAPYGENKRR